MSGLVWLLEWHTWKSVCTLPPRKAAMLLRRDGHWRCVCIYPKPTPLICSVRLRLSRVGLHVATRPRATSATSRSLKDGSPMPTMRP